MPMFSLFRTQKTTTATINGTPVPVGPQETLLLAALRHGIDFPHSCRVGGCKSCKCRLEEGKVHELTETDYILSDEELEAGCILACQSVPVSDVRISVQLAAATRRTTGRVVTQTRLARDITRLVVELDEAIDYRAGQFAGIGIASLPGVMRSYSFASAPGQGNRVAFLVRKVPGGRFSSRINDEQVTGEVVTIDGPMGDFWLRDGTAPLLMSPAAAALPRFSRCLGMPRRMATPAR
jgi:ferredoxin